jgi:hypothetical protein
MPKREVNVAPAPPDKAGVWTRLRRSLFGEAKSVFED